MATTQFPSTTQFRRKKKVSIFPGTQDVQLDRFQRTLIEMMTSASDIALGKFFRKNHRPLYQFLLRLYIISLTNVHPDRGRINLKDNSINHQDIHTTKEHQIISEWANLLTDDEPLIHNENILETPPYNNNINIDHLKLNENNDINTPTSPTIKHSKTSNSEAADIDAKIDTTSDNKISDPKNNRNKNKKHKNRNENASFQDFAEFATAIAMMKSRQEFNDNYNMKELSDIKTEYDTQYGPCPMSPRSLRRDSIWNGVLDVNNITISPSVPKWRSRSSIQEMQLSEDGILDCIISNLSVNNNNTNNMTNNFMLIKEVSNTSEAALSLFLPFLCVFSSKITNQNAKKELQTVILQRVVADDDIQQVFQFFLNSYKDAPSLLKAFKKNNISLMKRHKSSKTANVSDNKSKSKASTKDITEDSKNMKAVSNVQIIEQRQPESAISFFLSLFRYNLSSGSEVKLCSESRIRDPINNGAPPLSRIEVRDVMQTKSKPYFCDLYVSNRNDINNFEYLSSTVILKKGDDLRRDIAVLQCFRFMNKIWREKGLSFSNCSISAMTYKCAAVSPTCGIIEVIEGCKPLRLISVLEDNITISQQFNLIASAVGSYIGAFVMGVRDRHFDNVLIRTSDCILFHIDFGFVLGETASVDTSKFAITNDLKKLMGPFWDKFIELGVQAYLALREKHKILIKYAQIAFEYLNKNDQVETFIKTQLHIDDMNDHRAAKYIARKLKESPNSARTKFKNVVHKLATIMD